MRGDKLPDRIRELSACSSTTEIDLAKAIRQYNKLPAGHPKRQGVYKKIKDLADYSQDWD